jgi:excisionase family DNA binding protein
MESIEERLSRIEAKLDILVKRQTVKDWYTTAEVGEILGMTGYTVREWARHGRIRATKRPCGRGRSKEWIVSHDELTRIRNEGLLPLYGQLQNGAS